LAARLLGGRPSLALERCVIDGQGALLPDGLHKDPENLHRHAFWLSGDADEDGLIDHAWLFATCGLPREVLAAAALVEFIRVGISRFDVTPEWMGSAASCASFGPSKEWQALTPYITPRHRLTKTGKERPAFSAEVQLREELAARGWPQPLSVTWTKQIVAREQCPPAPAYEFVRQKGTKPPTDAEPAFPAVTFSEPVTGPLAFGYGAHFGLGQLLPVGGS